MIVKGKIINIIDANTAEVALVNNLACQGCQGCIAAAASCEQKTILAKNNFPHQVGDEVELELPAKYYYRSFLFLFLIPLFLLLFTIFLLNALGIKHDLLLLIGFLVFFASYFFSTQYEKKIKKEIVYTVIN